MQPCCFKDSSNTIWNCKINLRKALTIDRSDFSLYTQTPIIMSRFDRDAIQEMLMNQSLMFAVIGVIVRDQAKENCGVNLPGTPEDEERFQELFADRIDGPTSIAARNAFIEALEDFFPAAKTALSTFVQKTREWEEKANSRLNGEVMTFLDKKFEEALDEEILRLRENASGTSSLSPPA